MDTKLTVDEIQIALRNSGIWNKRQDIFIPNLSWGLLNYEADLVIITKSGYLTEVEISRKGMNTTTRVSTTFTTASRNQSASGLWSSCRKNMA